MKINRITKKPQTRLETLNLYQTSTFDCKKNESFLAYKETFAQGLKPYFYQTSPFEWEENSPFLYDKETMAQG